MQRSSTLGIKCKTNEWVPVIDKHWDATYSFLQFPPQIGCWLLGEGVCQLSTKCRHLIDHDNEKLTLLRFRENYSTSCWLYAFNIYFRQFQVESKYRRPPKRLMAKATISVRAEPLKNLNFILPLTWRPIKGTPECQKLMTLFEIQIGLGRDIYNYFKCAQTSVWTDIVHT